MFHLAQLRAFHGSIIGIVRFFVFFVQQVLYLRLLCHLLCCPVQLCDAVQFQRVLLHILQAAGGKTLARVVLRRPCDPQLVRQCTALLHGIGHAAAVLRKCLHAVIIAKQHHGQAQMTVSGIQIPQRFRLTAVQVGVSADILHSDIRGLFV